MRWLIGLCLVLFLSACATGPAPAAADRLAFAAVVVRDVDASADWYQRVFGLSEVNRATSAEFDVRILAGEGVMFELIELIPGAAERPDRVLGISKAGFEIANWDAQIAAWRATGVSIYNDRVFTDPVLRMHNAILVDPDGNMIQVYARAD